ncbi:hypothetical protein BELL_0018g00330 [Botrytis elliptica]|uniref:Uncharacterized protein n=1 Tax=Botrytis elliptica TaxID=278938 RepID=A0A4Z1K2F1_9HELO|nr:hypothetical protein BELL_0018g00330 [Botrytis elliptica]
MNPNLGKLYYQFTSRPKEMTAWENEDWIDEKSKETRRRFYVPKGEIFCRAPNQDGSLCENTKRDTPVNLWRHYRTMHAEFKASATRTRYITKEQEKRAEKCFEKQVLLVLRANNIDENGTWDELTDMIKNYELREKEATQIEQLDDDSESSEQNDPALISIRRPVEEVFSKKNEKNAREAKSLPAIGKVIGIKTERQKMVSLRKRAVPDTGKEGNQKRARMEEKTSLSADGIIEINP